MAEINEGHERIRHGQKEVREKFEEISKETAKLKEETNIISKQSAANQVRLDLMFQIIKARSENDAPRDAVLTQILRFVVLQTPLFCFYDQRISY
jgi:CHASE3 domain sensor protein